MKKFIIASFLLIMSVQGLFAQDWVVPAERRNRLSTFPFTDETRKEGEKIYTVNCISCHGNPGKANYLNLVPPPGDPATDKIQRNSDGEIFYKVSTGKGQMPSFRSVLAVNEIWNVISYLRSFNPAYKQQVMQAIASAAYPGAEIKLEMSYTEGDTMIYLRARAVKEASSVPVKDAAVRLYVTRRFGRMLLDEEKVTDGSGIAAFRVPSDLPGDTAGNVILSAGFSDESTFGQASKDTVLAAGIRTIPVSLVAERAMWNRVSKAPVWVILTFSLGLILVWAFIFVVLFKLRDIFIIGESMDDEIKE